MFNKKELEEIQTGLKEIKENHSTVKEELSKEVKEHVDKALEEMKKEITEIKEKQSLYFEEFDKSLESFKNLNNSYKKEFDNLNLLKNQLTEKVLDKLEKDLKTEMGKHLEDLSVEKTKFKEIQKELDALRAEVEKHKGISQQIKGIDFELTSYMKKLREEDQEKLKLMKRVDDLQTIIAKMRQKRAR